MGKPSRAALIVSAIVVAIVVAMVLVAASTIFVMRHVSIQPQSDEAARNQFDEARRRFAGQPPMIEIAPDGSVRTRLEDRAGKSAAELSTLHVLVWDPDRGKLVRADIPFWALRFKNSLPGMRNGASAWALWLPDNPDVGKVLSHAPMLQIEDIERYGPGLVLDHETPRGQHVLMWTQ